MWTCIASISHNKTLPISQLKEECLTLTQRQRITEVWGQSEGLRGVSHPSAPQCQEGRRGRQRLCGRCQRIPCPDLRFPSSQSSSLGWWLSDAPPWSLPYLLKHTEEQFDPEITVTVYAVYLRTSDFMRTWVLKINPVSRMQSGKEEFKLDNEFEKPQNRSQIWSRSLPRTRTRITLRNRMCSYCHPVEKIDHYG